MKKEAQYYTGRSQCCFKAEEGGAGAAAAAMLCSGALVNPEAETSSQVYWSEGSPGRGGYQSINAGREGSMGVRARERGRERAFPAQLSLRWSGLLWSGHPPVPVVLQIFPKRFCASSFIVLISELLLQNLPSGIQLFRQVRTLLYVSNLYDTFILDVVHRKVFSCYLLS